MTILPFQVELKEGPLDQFTHEMEPFLRKQGMPVRLNKGLHTLSLSLTHTLLCEIINLLILMMKYRSGGACWRFCCV